MFAPMVAKLEEKGLYSTSSIGRCSISVLLHQVHMATVKRSWELMSSSYTQVYVAPLM